MSTESHDLYHLAYDKMSYYLGVRDHSLKELEDKLGQKFPQDIVNQVLEKAIGNGWILPPDEMAKQTTEALHRKNKGFLYISNYLEQKGLPEVDRDDEVELQKACGIVESRLDLQDNKLTDEQKQKAIRLLQNRGFDNETIKKVIYEIY